MVEFSEQPHFLQLTCSQETDVNLIVAGREMRLAKRAAIKNGGMQKEAEPITLGAIALLALATGTGGAIGEDVVGPAMSWLKRKAVGRSDLEKARSNMWNAQTKANLTMRRMPYMIGGAGLGGALGGALTGSGWGTALGALGGGYLGHRWGDDISRYARKLWTGNWGGGE